MIFKTVATTILMMIFILSGSWLFAQFLRNAELAEGGDLYAAFVDIADTDVPCAWSTDASDRVTCRFTGIVRISHEKPEMKIRVVQLQHSRNRWCCRDMRLIARAQRVQALCHAIHNTCTVTRWETAYSLPHISYVKEDTGE